MSRSDIYGHYSRNHFKEDILNRVGEGNQCSFCSVIFTNPHHKASHYGRVHNMLESFLPKQHHIPASLNGTRISEGKKAKRIKLVKTHNSKENTSNGQTKQEKEVIRVAYPPDNVQNEIQKDRSINMSNLSLQDALKSITSNKPNSDVHLNLKLLDSKNIKSKKKPPHLSKPKERTPFLEDVVMHEQEILQNKTKVPKIKLVKKMKTDDIYKSHQFLTSMISHNVLIPMDCHQMTSLSSHTRPCHSYCTVCGQQFSSVRRAIVHEVEACQSLARRGHPHFRLKVFQCTVCNKSFVLKRKYELHMSRHEDHTKETNDNGDDIQILETNAITQVKDCTGISAKHTKISNNCKEQPETENLTHTKEGVVEQQKETMNLSLTLSDTSSDEESLKFAQELFAKKIRVQNQNIRAVFDLDSDDE